MPTLPDRLAANSTRYLGCANEVATEALTNPALVTQLVEALKDKRELVQHRAANALKKIQRSNPALLEPFAKQILRATINITHLHTRWNLTIILGELPLRGRDKLLATDLMFEALASSSALQRTFALTALANYAENDPTLRTRLKPILDRALTDPSAAIRARTRKLLKQLAG